MAKIKLLTVIGMCGIVLAACGGEKTTSNETTESQTSVAEESTVLEGTTSSEAIDVHNKVSESEFGTLTNLGEIKDINETQQSGPFTVTVEEVQKAQLQPVADYVDMMGGEDLAVISIKLSVENTNEDTNMIYPDQGTIVTDTKQQVDADMFLSESVGGDFLGEVVKSGTIFFVFDGNAEDVKSFQYVVGSGSDSDFNNFGEDLTFDFSF